MLSEGIQLHLSQLVDASVIHSRKRTNRTAIEHFMKSQFLIEKEFPNSSSGEVMPENRGNLGMLWGPPRLEELDEEIMKTNDQYNEKRIALTETIKQELSQDDEKRLQRKKGGGGGGGVANDLVKDWWIRDVRPSLPLLDRPRWLTDSRTKQEILEQPHWKTLR
jgi:hypothetical protein